MNHNEKLSILVVEDEESFRSRLLSLLSPFNEVQTADTIREAKRILASHQFDLCVLDYRLPDGLGTELIPEIKKGKHGPIIFLSGDENPEIARKCQNLGIDFIIKGLAPENELLLTIPKVIQSITDSKRQAQIVQRQQNSFKYELIGTSEVVTNLRKTIGKLGSLTLAHVLITGPSGTGKELVARRLNSAQGGSRPFIQVNCAAIPESLFETEFFGHSRGSFTGAHQSHVGYVEQANSGDLFLDEIGELPLNLQAKLLRVLQSGEYTPVGSTTTKRSNLRAIAATNKSLEALVKLGTFREDLFYRLNVMSIKTPALSDHTEDIPVLSTYLLMKIAGPKYKFADQVTDYLRDDCTWPGNVRELGNSIERAVISAKMRESNVINTFDFGSLHTHLKTPIPPLPQQKLELSRDLYTNYLSSMERLFFSQSLKLCNGNASEMARLLGLSYPTVCNRIKEMNLRVFQ